MTSVGLLKIADITLERSTYDACIRRDMKGTRKGYTSILKVWLKRIIIGSGKKGVQYV